MKLSSRLLRRVIIVVIFLVVFTSLGYGTKKLTQAPAICTDGIKNGDEEGIDCGLAACNKYCEPDIGPPQVVLTKIIPAGDKDYDFVAEVVNTHKDLGASEVVYELTLFNSNDEELFKKEGSFYILPGQTKYLILPFITTERNVTRNQLIIKSAKWQKIESLEGLNLVVRRDRYKDYGSSSTLDAAIFNDSDFDFEIVDIDVVLKNSSDQIIAVNRSEIRTFGARTERSFKVTWPFPIKGTVAKTEIKASTNLFENSNFIKRYGLEVEKFQQYK